MLRNNYFRYKKQWIRRLPIPEVNRSKITRIAKESSSFTKELEQAVYSLYGLNAKEQAIIEAEIRSLAEKRG